MAAKAKEVRDEAEIKLVSAMEELNIAVTAEPTNKRVIGGKIRKVEIAFEKVQRVHSQYCQKTKIGLSSTDSTEYLRGLVKLKVKSVSVARDTIGEDSDESEAKESTSNLEGEQFQLMVDVEGKVASLSSLSTTALLTREQYGSIMDMLEDGEDKLGRYMECADLMQKGLDATAAEKIKSDSQTFFKTSKHKLTELRCLFLSKAPIKSEAPSPRVASVPSIASGPVRVAGKQPVKIKAMDCPTWDGKYRSFPRFKKLWEENISPRHEDTALHYMLCQALPKSILDNISTLSDSAEDIWRYLDDKFGKSDVVAREVMGELMSLDHRKLGQHFIGRFTTMLLDTQALLGSINEIEWLVSNRSVAELEDRLPHIERVEWARQMGSVSGDTKFERFKNFLLGRKKVLENMDTMGCRPGGAGSLDKCEYCSKPGHVEDDCLGKKKALGSSPGGGGFVPKGRGGCAICQSMDHWKNECPEKGTKKDSRTGGNKIVNSTTKNNRNGGKGGGGNSDGGAVADREVGSNTLRAQECQRCKFADKLTFCPGCKKSAGINHCLFHCEGFMVLSVKDRVDIVKSSKSCAICLHSSHTTDKCFSKDKDNHVCGVNGCTSHHHPYLHGSKDVYVTGVNALLRQRYEAVTTVGVPDFVPVDNWVGRSQYVFDSFPVVSSSNTASVCKTAVQDQRSTREIELDEVRAELAKPLVNGDKVLMCMMSLSVISGEVGVHSSVVGFFDDGSNCSVVKNEVAVRLGLWGDPVTLELGTVNATTSLRTKLYCVELLDKLGNRHLIKAFGLETLSGPLPTIHLDGIKHEFSVDVRKNWGKFSRPTGEVELLIGSEVAHLHPQHQETVGRMVVRQSIFGTGWVLNGAHEGIVCGPVDFNGNLQIIRTGCFRSNRIVVAYKQEVEFNSLDEYSNTMSEKKFFAAESLGCEPPRRCQDCRGCQDCGFRGATMSQKEYMELKKMEDNIWFDKKLGKWRVRYAFKQDPRVLRNNYRRVLRMSETTERRLAKSGKTDEANELFHKMVKMGALEEIGAAELNMWKGPEHYLPIQAVIKDSSVTTPLRLVTNSSLIDPETGLSLNSILVCGPCCLNDMWEMLVRFRHHECALCGDITKAYYQMHTGPVEKHVRRVLWRDGKVGTPWRIFGFTVVSMGDSPAANFMELTKKKTADMSKHIDVVAASKIKKDSFVDDISTGGTREECARFKGTEDAETLACDGTIPEILETGGWALKAVVVSGEEDGPALQKLGGAVLGLGFSTAQDMLHMKFRVNVSGHLRGKPTDPDLTVETLDKLATAVITKRTCLRVVSSQYDPLGVATCLVIILKVQLKELYKLGLDWDIPLEGGLRNMWVKLFEMLVRCGGIRFMRTTKPDGTVGRCVLVCFFDGSDVAFGLVIYVRWVLEDGSVWVYLLAARSRIAPLFGTSTPRVELEGATLLTRVVVRVIRALVEDPPAKVYFLGDSETVLASRERDKGFFGEFFGNRIGEQYDNEVRIQNLVEDITTEWHHLASEDNAADRTSRIHSLPEDLGLDSEWMTGPAYLKLPVEQWPINRDFADRKSKVKLPMEEIRKQYRDQLSYLVQVGVGEQMGSSSVATVGPGSLDNPVLEHFQFGKKTNDWRKLNRSTSYLFKWYVLVFGDKSSAGMGMAEDMASTFWLRVAMPATNLAASQGKLKHLNPQQHFKYPDMLVVVGRAVAGFQNLFQKDFLPIIMAKTRTAWLVMVWAHCQDHAGVDTSFQPSMQVAWIVGGRTLAKGIKKACVRCRYLARQLLDQQMSVLPPHLTVPCPPFSFVAVDLAGPFVCKREGASKSTRRNPGTMKVWAVLIVCLQVKAVKIYLVGGLNTEDFLLAWDSFVADHGQPLVAYGDRGTNLTSAAKEGGETDVPSYDWDNIAGSSQGKTDWQFHPAGSQFRNGAVEVFVKKFKRTLKHRFAGKLMFLLELEASFKIVASILNSRPIYARWGPRGGSDTDYLSALTPNMLLTGRANTEVPIRNYEASDKPLYRLQYVEECVAQWWEQFMSQNFSSLVPRQKWFYEKRNMEVGDVVLIQYEGKCRPATYRLGVVCELELSPDDLVRTVWVEYSLLAELPEAERHLYKGITKKKIRVSVQRLVLILPVEERESVLLPGGQAGQGPAPHDEVSVGSNTGGWKYPVVLDAARKNFVWDTRAAEVMWDLNQEKYVFTASGQLAGEGVRAGDHSEGVHIQGDGQVGKGGHVGAPGEGDVGVLSGMRKELVGSMRSCQMLESKITCADFEKKIYLQLSTRFYGSDVESDL